jgi:hypothetical protein
LEIGRDLVEIRDDELWKSDDPKKRKSKDATEWDYPTWNQYLKVQAEPLIQRTWSAATKLIQCAEIESKMPPSINVYTEKMTPSHIRELGRLAPNDGTDGTSRNYTAIKKRDVDRVMKAAEKIADGDPVSVRDIQKAVDAEKGIDRKAEAAKAKAKRERDSQIDLDDYLSRIKGTSEGWLQVLEAVPADAWEDYASEIDEAASALESLFTFLRS